MFSISRPVVLPLQPVAQAVAWLMLAWPLCAVAQTEEAAAPAALADGRPLPQSEGGDIRSDSQSPRRPSQQLAPQVPPAQAATAVPQGTTFLSGDKLIGRSERDIVLEGQADVRRDELRIRGDRLSYDQDSDEARAQGNVRLSRAATLFRGPAARLRIDASEGEMQSPSYEMRNTGGNGHAERIEFLGPDRYRAEDATYTTCKPESPDWEFRARQLDIDDDRKIGIGRNAKLYFFDMPIMAVPVFSFPLTNERRSGFLTPLMGLTSTSGVDLTLPYYLNIAPNRDLTLYPRLLSKRGLQLGSSFRYLEPDYSGELRGDYLPSDRVAGRDRWSYSWRHRQTLLPGLNAYLNLNKVSDDAYPVDLGRNLTSAVQLQYAREAGLNYVNGNWTTLLRTQRFQTLAPNTPVYQRLPQLNTRYLRQDWNGFDLSFEADATRFTYPTAVMPSANRFYAIPQISYPLVRPGYFLIPKAMLHLSSYQIDTVGGSEQNVARTLPTLSLDAGLVFDRPAPLLSGWFGRPMTQTLEPRVFYVRTPFRDQSQIPLFDTSQLDFGYAQIFTENPFVGNDRIADNNKLTFGVTSRLIESGSGIEQFRLTFAQRLDMQGQRVTLTTTQPPGEKIYSDMLLATSARLLGGAYLDAGVQYNPNLNAWNRTSIGLGWRPEKYRTLNIGYRSRQAQYSGDPLALEQLDTSAQWPITGRLYGVGRLNYDLRGRALSDALAGFEYDGGCWAGRLLLQRFANPQGAATGSTSGGTTTHFYVQLEFRGLSNIGSTGTLSLLRLNVPGYTPVSPKPVAPATSTDDE